MRKKLFLCVFVLALIFTIIIPVHAKDVAKIEIQTPVEMPKNGEEFEVTAYISDNPGFNAIQFTLSYECDVMECTDIEIGEILKGTLYAVNPNMSFEDSIFGAVRLEPIEGDGILVTYKFIAKEDITEFNFTVSGVKFVDTNAEKLDYAFVGAEEVIPAPTESEANGSNSSDGTTDIGDDIVVTEHIFEDATGHWAEGYINAATNLGIFKGDEKGFFKPDDNVTRAQFVTVLHRMSGSPAATTEAPFTDIANQSDEFRGAIAWGYENGYINGTSETTFSPETSLTREEAMKILHSYSGGKTGNEIFFASIYNAYFDDSAEISEWAKSSLYWGVYNRLIFGTGATTLSPSGTATRAQLAKILVKYINTYNN